MKLPIPCPTCNRSPDWHKSYAEAAPGSWTHAMRQTVELSCPCRVISGWSGVQAVALWNAECAKEGE